MQKKGHFFLNKILVFVGRGILKVQEPLRSGFLDTDWLWFLTRHKFQLELWGFLTQCC